VSHSRDAVNAKDCIYNLGSISQAGRRGFEPRLPLHFTRPEVRTQARLPLLCVSRRKRACTRSDFTSTVWPSWSATSRGSSRKRPRRDRARAPRGIDLPPVHPLSDVGVPPGEMSPHKPENLAGPQPCNNRKLGDQPFSGLKDCKAFLHLPRIHESVFGALRVLRDEKQLAGIAQGASFRDSHAEDLPHVPPEMGNHAVGETGCRFSVEQGLIA
jgi:hypothetical protein